MIIEELDLSVRAYNCLKRAGIHTVEQLSEMEDEQLLKVRNISQKCVEEIRAKVSRPGKTNGDRIRSMDDEELAWELIFWRDDWGDYKTHAGCFDKWEDALRAEIDWLKQPAKEDA